MYSKIVAMVFSLFVITLVLSGCGSSTSVDTPLRGTWRMTNNADTSFDMTAHVANHQIKIVLSSGDTKALYWKGTFPTDVLKDEATLVSKGDQRAMDASMLGSQDKNKKFTYSNGELSYSFSMLGVTKTIHLER